MKSEEFREVFQEFFLFLVSTVTFHGSGKLIVSEQKGREKAVDGQQRCRYEVMDGQQRLTALYLLLRCLDVKVENTLTFACRDKSNYTLRNIDNLADEEKIEQSIQRGRRIIEDKLGEEGFDKEAFKEKIMSVIIYP